MEFDKSKVLDELSENIEQFVGKKGWFSDSLFYLKRFVEEQGRKNHYGTLKGVYKDSNSPFVCGDNRWAFFYPDEQGVSTVKDLIKAFGRIDNVWVRDKQTGIISLVLAYNFAENLALVERSGWMDVSKFLDAYEVVDLNKYRKGAESAEEGY